MSMTLDEMFASYHFRRIANEQIGVIRAKREGVLRDSNIVHKMMRKTKTEKSRLKADAFSTLDNEGLLFPDDLVQEFYLITEKKSKLAYRERAWVADFITGVIQLCTHFFDDEAKKRVESIIQTPE